MSVHCRASHWHLSRHWQEAIKDIDQIRNLVHDKKDCTLCPCCRTSTFEKHQAFGCAVTAQNETTLEVGAFLHVLCEKCRRWVKISSTTSPSLRDSTFFLPPPTTCNTFLPVSRSGLVGEMPRASWELREIFLSIILFFTHHSVLTVPGEHLSTLRCVCALYSLGQFPKVGLLTYCLSHAPFITDVFTCLSARTITSW